MDESIEDYVQKLKERTEQRRAKLYPTEQSSIALAEPEEVSYPPLSPLPEEGDTLSMAETDKQDESSIAGLKSDTSNLDYSSDLSLECDADTTLTDNCYRAEPVVCHASPDRGLVQQATQSRQTSPRKATLATSNLETYHHQPITRYQPANQQHHQHRSDQPVMPLIERRNEQTVAPTQIPTPRPMTSDEQLMKDLTRKIERAENSIKQLSKAVTYSKNGTKEHVEAARLLKMAQVELHDFRLHKHKLDNGLRKKADSLGSLKLSNIGFETRSALKEDLALDGVFHYFFCIASCGPEVKTTEIIDTDRIRAQRQKDYIQFQEELSFVDLPPDFVVVLQIFEYVKKPMKFVERTLEVLSTPKKSRPTTETEFSRIGFIKLSKEDRKNDEPKMLKFENGSKYINKRFRFEMDLHPEQMPCKASMLHVRRIDADGRPDWSRFWIDLSKGRILFWKSKQDALDKMRPEYKVEMKNLCSESVQKLTPDDDLYRQNSFVLYEKDQRRGEESDTFLQRILSNGTHKVVKHQFAADNKEDRDSWCALLDKSMLCFREWNGQAEIRSVDELRELFSG